MFIPLSADSKPPYRAAAPRRARAAQWITFLCLTALVFVGGSARASIIEVDAGITGGDCCAFQTMSNVPGIGTSDTTVHVGDTVHWIWKTDAHSVTTDTGEWADSGVHNTGFTFDHTFSTAGTFDYYCIIHGDSGMTGAIKVVASAASVSGHLALEGVSDLAAVSSHAPLGLFTIEFRTPGTLSVLFTATAALTPANGSPFGAFSIGSVTAGTYDIAIKGGKNLRVVKRGVPVSGATMLTDTTLLAGDSNGDNSIDPTDFGVFVSAYNTDGSVPGSGYDPTCDFNFDGFVDPTDFGLFVGNYGREGDR